MTFWQQALINTLFIVSGVTTLSVLISLPAAWAFERSDLPGKRFFTIVFSLPYVIPSYLLAISWITLANPAVGWINQLLGRATDAPFINVYGLTGIIFIEASALFSILFLSFRASLSQMDPSLEEAARLCGAGPFRIFFQITCPLLKKGILASIVAIALASLASFGVPAMIGGPARIYVLTTGIYSLLKQGSFSAYREALVISFEMGIASLLLVFLTRLLDKKKHSLVGGKSARPAIHRLGRARRPLFAIILLLWFVMTGLPVLSLVASSFMKNPSNFALSEVSLLAWKYVLTTLPGFWLSVRNSLTVSFLAAAAVLLLSLPICLLAWQGHYGRSRGSRWFSRFIEDGALFAYSLPGTVIAVGLIYGVTRAGFFSLSDSLALIALALVIKYLTLSLRTLGPAAFLVHPSLIEAARLSGANLGSRLRRIWVPLLGPALLASGLLVLMPCLAELTMSILLVGPSTETLGVSLFHLQEYADRSSAACVGTLLLAAVILFQSLIGRIGRDVKV